MTKREATIIEAYTGICMLTGEDTKLVYDYASKLLGFQVFTHNFGDKKIQNSLLFSGFCAKMYMR